MNSSTSFVCTCNSTYCDTFTLQVPEYGNLLQVVSSKDDKRFEKTVLEFTTSTSPSFSHSSSSNFSINIPKNPRRKQKIVGFGGALTDATAIMVSQLPAVAQDLFFESYFSSKGIEYNLVRTNIAGCDFSVREYTYCDMENDFELVTFDLAPEDTEFKIPMLKKIKSEFSSRDSLRYFASAWTAPKESGKYFKMINLLGF